MTRRKLQEAPVTPRGGVWRPEGIFERGGVEGEDNEEPDAAPGADPAAH